MLYFYLLSAWFDDEITFVSAEIKYIKNALLLYIQHMYCHYDRTFNYFNSFLVLFYYFTIAKIYQTLVVEHY